MPKATAKAHRIIATPPKAIHETRKFYWSGYKTSRWRRRRALFLKINPLCKECEKENKAEPAVVVDHIRPIQDGCDPWDETNWQGLCYRHDAKKRGQTKRTRGGG